MNTQEFIEAIQVVVINGSINAIKSILEKPPGRQPDKNIIELSNWFNKLTIENKTMVMKIVKKSVETSVFGFLCVLDGVSAIEDGKIKGRLVLSYEKEGDFVVLNDPDEEYLHNLI